MKSKSFYHSMAILLMMIWGMSYLSIKVVINEGIGPLPSAFLRFFLAAIILVIFLKLKYPKEKVLKEDRIKMILGGLFGVGLYFFFENYAVEFTSASNVAILLSLIPVFTLISQRIVFKEKLTLWKSLGAFLSMIGIIIIIASKEKISLFSTGTIGDLLTLAAAACWVVYSSITSTFKGEYKSITVTAHQAVWGCLFLAPGLLASPITSVTLKAALNLTYQSVFCTCLGYALYVYCLKHLGATVITTYINLQPIITLISAAVIIHEKITAVSMLGCAIIIAGVFLVSFGEHFNIKFFLNRI